MKQKKKFKALNTRMSEYVGYYEEWNEKVTDKAFKNAQRLNLMVVMSSPHEHGDFKETYIDAMDILKLRDYMYNGNRLCVIHTTKGMFYTDRPVTYIMTFVDNVRSMNEAALRLN